MGIYWVIWIFAGFSCLVAPDQAASQSTDDENEQIEELKYDAFLCYSHIDFPWIQEIFWKNDSILFDIERDHGIRLVFHDRDFIAGRPIRENIIYGIQKSRRVVFILSRHFLNSKLGMEELRLADAHTLNGSTKIIIILKEKLEDIELPEVVKTYMETFTYIDATKNLKQVPERLRFALPRIPLRRLKPELRRRDIDAFNFDDLISDDEDPVPVQRRSRDDELEAPPGGQSDSEPEQEDENTRLLPNQTRVQVHHHYGAVN